MARTYQRVFLSVKVTLKGWMKMSEEPSHRVPQIAEFWTRASIWWLAKSCRKVIYHINEYENLFIVRKCTLPNFLELDEQIISDLADILDSPNKEWEKLADSLDLLLSMRSVLDKQQSPTTYLLSNMDVSQLMKLKFAIFYFLKLIARIFTKLATWEEEICK